MVGEEGKLCLMMEEEGKQMHQSHMMEEEVAVTVLQDREHHSLQC